MKHSTTILGSIFCALLLAGVGCIGKSGSTGGAVSDAGGIWKSVDGGKTFASVSVVPTGKGMGSLGNMNILSLAADPSDPKTLYTGTISNGLFFTYDAAGSWTQSPDARMKQGAVVAAVVDPSEKCRVYVARPDRIVRTEDCNRSFEREVYVQAKEGTTMTALAIDWYDPSVLYAGTSDGAVLRSGDRGATWATAYRARQAITSLLVSYADSRVVIAGVAGGGLLRSVDSGESWENSVEQLKPYKDAGQVFALSQDKEGQVMIAATFYSLLRSQDAGETWEPLALLTAPREVTIRAVAVDPASADHVLYSVGNGLYESADGGTTWSVKKLRTTREVSSILFDATDSSIVYLGLRKIETK